MWRTVKLGQVIEKTRTVNPSTEFPNDYFEYVDVSSVNNATLKIEETQKLLGEDAPSRARREILENDVIFATIRPTLRRIALVPSSLNGQICSTGYTVLRANRKQILQTFLFYVMIGSKAMSYMKNSQTGTSYPAVTDKQVKDFEISLPPLAEQQRIIEKLDGAFAEIDRAIALAEAKEAEVDKLKSSWLSLQLNSDKWMMEKLGSVCDFEGGSQPPKSEFIYQPADGYVRFIQIRDFKSDKNITYIPITKKNRLCFQDDVLIGRYGASVGQILSGLAGAYNVALMKTIPRQSVISRDWLKTYLTSTLFQKPLMEVSSRSAQNGFSKNDIFDFDVPVPPLAEQKRIIEKLDLAVKDMETLSTATLKMIGCYTSLKSAILAQELQQQQSEAA